MPELMNPLQSAMTSVAAGRARMNFNLQFDAMQKTMIHRLNEKIEKARDNPVVEHELADLDTKIKHLQARQPALADYGFKNSANQALYARMQETAEALTATAESDGDPNNISAAEAAAFNAQKATLVSQLREVRVIQHEDIIDTGVNAQIRKLADQLEATVLVEGPVDAAGTDPATNGNRAALDLVERVYNMSVTGENVSTNMATACYGMLNDISSKVADAQAKQIEINTEAYTKTNKEIDDLKERTRIFLQAISIGFEVQQSSQEAMNKQLAGSKADPGSVVSLFA